MKRRIVPDESVCIGCRLCEVHCTAAHSDSGDLIKAFNKQKTRALPKLRVAEKGARSFALQCRNCDEPACVAACITGAMHKNEQGEVVHEADRCVGCWSCVMVCPYGAISRDENEKRVASKCDLCAGRETPACVEHCPNRALRLVEVEK